MSLQVAVEFTTASVTSPGVDMIAEKAPSLPGNPTQQLLDLAETGLQISNNQSMQYANIRQRGEQQTAVVATVAALPHANSLSALSCSLRWGMLLMCMCLFAAHNCSFAIPAQQPLPKQR
jgi:hypothetical protein